MFWKKKVKLSITQDDKEWVDSNLKWIFKNLIQIEKQEIKTIESSFKDYTFLQKEEDAQYLVSRIGEILSLNTENIVLEFYSEENIELEKGITIQNLDNNGSAGTYTENENTIYISIEIRQLEDTQSLISTIAHEMAHYELLKINQIEVEGEENEYFTDLFTIANGFGTFLANSKFKFEQWQDGDGWGGWSTTTQGYLPLQLITYSMARIEFLKGKTEITFLDSMNKESGNLTSNCLNYLLENEQIQE